MLYKGISFYKCMDFLLKMVIYSKYSEFVSYIYQIPFLTFKVSNFLFLRTCFDHYVLLTHSGSIFHDMYHHYIDSIKKKHFQESYLKQIKKIKQCKMFFSL